MRIVNVKSLSELRHVRCDKVSRRNLRYFPDFLILGPQRTGTTWLAKILWRHPQVFMSFPKELYYFNLLNQTEHRFYKTSDLAWYVRQFRDNPASYAAKSWLALTKHRELYRPVIRGEATASYAAMDPEIISEVVKINPDIKCIVIVRDPVERAWSHAKKDLMRVQNRRVQDVSHEEFEAFFRDPYQLACGDYTSIIRNWSAALKPGNLFVGQFEDVGANPGQFLQQLLRFLGVSDDLKYVSELLNVRVNPTEDADIPDGYRELLGSIFAGATRDSAGRGQ